VPDLAHLDILNAVSGSQEGHRRHGRERGKAGATPAVAEVGELLVLPPEYVFGENRPQLVDTSMKPATKAFAATNAAGLSPFTCGDG
jgi:hypothetical protein